MNWKIKVIDKLGLKEVMVRNYVFRPPKPAQYQLEYKDGTYEFQPIINGKKRDPKGIYPDLNVAAYVLRKGPNLFVPIIHITKHRRTQSEIPSFEPTMEAFEQVPKSEGYYESSPQHIALRRRQLIIFSHGNASDLGDVFYFGMRIVKEYDVDFIGYDYTGYGYGLGKYVVSEKQTYDDLQAVLSFAVHNLNYSLSEIVLWGFSLGSGPTTEIGSRYTSLSGVVLQAPLASLYQWFGRKDLEYDIEDIYQNINKIQAIRSKLLLIHGDEDDIVPISHSQMLYDKYIACAREAQSIQFIKVRSVGHNNLQQKIESGLGELGTRIQKFLDSFEVRPDYMLKENQLLELFLPERYEPKTNNYKSNLVQLPQMRPIVDIKKTSFGICLCQQD